MPDNKRLEERLLSEERMNSSPSKRRSEEEEDKKEDTFSEESAQKAIAESRGRRAKACQDALGELLKQYNCDLVAFQQVINGQFGQMEIRVVPR